MNKFYVSSILFFWFCIGFGRFDLFMYERLNILIGVFLCLLENEDPGNDILACPICKKKYLSVETKEKHLIQFHRKKCYPGKLLKEN